MQSVSLIIVILAIAFIVWLGLHQSTTRLVSFRKSGLAYFKALLRLRGIEVNRIPDAALFEIIKAKIIKIRVEAGCGVVKGTGQVKHWRAQMACQLEAEANLIVLLMAEGPVRQPNSDAAIALTKYGVFVVSNPAAQAAFTPESFAEATRRGTLYAELSARISQREVS